MKKKKAIIGVILVVILSYFCVKALALYYYDVKNITKDNLKNIKFEEDPDKAMLLKLQDDLEKDGINAENAYKLTKNLSETQKNKLLNLYKEQIKMYETSIKNYKNKILAIRKNVM